MSQVAETYEVVVKRRSWFARMLGYKNVTVMRRRLTWLDFARSVSDKGLPHIAEALEEPNPILADAGRAV